MPVGAFGGRKEIMQHIAPSGKVYQAGTLSGNPLAMRAGYTMLQTLRGNPSLYDQLDQTTMTLENGFNDLFKSKGVPVQVNRAGSMLSIHFSSHAVNDFKTAAAADNEEFKKYFHYCLDHGVYLPPSPFESWFISTAIGEKDISHTLEVTSAYLKQR